VRFIIEKDKRKKRKKKQGKHMANLKSTQKVILVQKFILLIFQFLGWKKK
jgi:hypothetical protein